MLVALVLLVIAASIISDRFLTLPNIVNVVRQVAIVGILAVGMTFVILTKGIDLSVGSILGISVVLYAGLLETQSMWVRSRSGLRPRPLSDSVNGIGVAYARIPPFIMTLGMLSFVRGLAFIYTGGHADPDHQRELLRPRQRLRPRRSIPSLILLAVLVASGVLSRSLRSADRYTLSAPTRTRRASPGAGPSLHHGRVCHLRAGLRPCGPGLRLAALDRNSDRRSGLRARRHRRVVVGGTSLFGGKGSVIGTFIGTLIIGVLANILNLSGVDPFVQQLFKVR